MINNRANLIYYFVIRKHLTLFNISLSHKLSRPQQSPSPLPMTVKRKKRELPKELSLNQSDHVDSSDVNRSRSHLEEFIKGTDNILKVIKEPTNLIGFRQANHIGDFAKTPYSPLSFD